MTKTIRIIGITILLFFLVKICSKESAPPVDYTKMVETGLFYITHSYDNTYKLDINFRNIHTSTLNNIKAEFIFTDILGNEIIKIQKNILPAGYSLSSGATYPYKFYFESADEPHLKRVKILYAN